MPRMSSTGASERMDVRYVTPVLIVHSYPLTLSGDSPALLQRFVRNRGIN